MKHTILHKKHTSKISTKSNKPTSNTMIYPAVRGIQAGKEFYVAMCTLKSVARFFSFVDSDIPPELRFQRTLRKNRIPDIKNYIKNNANDYVFSSITVSVDGNIKFIPSNIDNNLGQMVLSQNTTILINDGQHRASAIKDAVEEMSELGNDEISVVFFQDLGLEKSQQMFADLNKHAVKPTKSIGILYDRRNAYSVFVVNMVKNLQIFKNRTELEKNTLSNRTLKFFTLNGVTTSTALLLGKSKRLSKQDKTIAMDFWDSVSKNIPEWILLMTDEVPAYEIRHNSVHANTNMLQAIGVYGNLLIKEFPNTWKKKLNGFKKIDWSRSNPEWDGKIVVNGRMMKNKIGINLVANILLSHCGAKSRITVDLK